MKSRGCRPEKKCLEWTTFIQKSESRKNAHDSRTDGKTSNLGPELQGNIYLNSYFSPLRSIKSQTES